MWKGTMIQLLPPGITTEFIHAQAMKTALWQKVMFHAMGCMLSPISEILKFEKMCIIEPMKYGL